MIRSGKLGNRHLGPLVGYQGGEFHVNTVRLRRASGSGGVDGLLQPHACADCRIHAGTGGYGHTYSLAGPYRHAGTDGNSQTHACTYTHPCSYGNACAYTHAGTGGNSYTFSRSCVEARARSGGRTALSHWRFNSQRLAG